MEIKLSRKSCNNGDKLTSEQIQESIDLYTSGATISQIAASKGFKDNVVAAALKRNNVPVYARNTRQIECFNHIEELITQYQEGKSLTELGKLHNMGPSTIKLILDKRGLYKKPSNTKVDMTSDHIQSAIHLAKQGMTHKDIGAQLGYSVWVIQRNLVAAGITRPKGQTNLTNYQSQVRRLTMINYNKYKNYINPSNLPRGKKTYHIDHIYSVYDGFTNNIPANVIAHPANLQMLSSKQNIIKRTKSHHTVEELMEKIKNFHI
jgi:hypothetical protein